MPSNHSFIVLAHEQSPYLEECIQSLLGQSVKSEIIIATGTPGQFLTHIAKKYSLPLKVNTGQKGLAESWNFALAQAATKYVTLAHQDDIYLSNYTEEMLKNLDSHSDFSIKFCDYQELYHSNNEAQLRTWTLNLLIKRLLVFFHFGFGEAISGQSAKKRFLRLGSAISCPSVLYNTKQIKDFTFNTSFKINVDWIAWIDLASNSRPFLKSNKILMQHRIHTDSETSKGLKGNIRQHEDLVCFSQLWPKKLAWLIAQFYSLSYWTN